MDFTTFTVDEPALTRAALAAAMATATTYDELADVLCDAPVDFEALDAMPPGTDPAAAVQACLLPGAVIADDFAAEIHAAFVRSSEMHADLRASLTERKQAGDLRAEIELQRLLRGSYYTDAAELALLPRCDLSPAELRDSIERLPLDWGRFFGAARDAQHAGMSAAAVRIASVKAAELPDYQIDSVFGSLIESTMLLHAACLARMATMVTTTAEDAKTIIDEYGMESPEADADAALLNVVRAADEWRLDPLPLMPSRLLTVDQIARRLKMPAEELERRVAAAQQAEVVAAALIGHCSRPGAGESN